MDIKYNEGKLDENICKLINKGFTEYDKAFDLSPNYKEFSFVAKENGKIAGILTGKCLHDEIKVSDLIVTEKFRKNGIGSKLLKSVEEYFSDKNYTSISLTTYDFQAPKFYEKCGFELEFVRKNKKNPKLTKYFLVKYL
ncbi:MAG: GNAT family N-acetyltransferase [Clostridia bacterium]|nr:GNAT family N-acetyltransferase [Clostridia bacterium]